MTEPAGPDAARPDPDRREPGRPVVALVGLRCSGKTTVGRALADRVSARFMDLDETIAARAGVPHAATIIEREGLDAFRRLEAATLADVLAAREGLLVLSTGGGAIESATSRRRLSKDAFGVWLRAPLELLRERMARGGGATRPPITRGEREDEFTVLDRRRAPLYAAIATLTLDVAGRTPIDLAGEIDRAWRR